MKWYMLFYLQMCSYQFCNTTQTYKKYKKTQKITTLQIVITNITNEYFVNLVKIE
jgi:hypothetical protein